MKRWTARILLCLLLGAVTTVAVAWGLGNTVQADERWTFYPPRETFPAIVPGIERHGWPMLALSTGEDSGDIHVAGTAVVIGSAWFGYAPIWPGFLIDTLFYGVLWFGMIVGFGAVRRTIRRKRGRCPNCGYDLRGHADHGRDGRATSGGGCPECGWGRVS